MLDEARWVFNGNHFEWLFFIFLIIEIIFLKGKRKILVLPAILITFTIVNPLIYNAWYHFNDRAYWRLIWIVPIIVICAVVPPAIVDRIKRVWVNAGILIVAIATYMFCGSMIYAHDSTTFKGAKNPEKLPDNVVKIAEVLLEFDETPYVVGESTISTYLRQYSGKIKTLYTRDVVYGGANSEEAKIVHNALCAGEEYATVAQIMLNNDYQYLVVEDEERGEAIESAGFRKILSIDSYGLYRVTGNRTEKREYNDKHQVISVTNVDKDGNPIVNEWGYETIQYQYDDYGRIICEKMLNEKEMQTDSEMEFNEKRYEYNQSNKSPLVYYFKNGYMLEMGNGYFHDYLTNLDRSKQIIFMSVFDDASTHLLETHVKDMNGLGIKIDLRGKWRNSYCAVIAQKSVIEEIDSKPIRMTGEVENLTFDLLSTGGNMGTGSSIVINGQEFSQNKRGLNIVVYDIEKQEVVDSVAFDTYDPLMLAYR